MLESIHPFAETRDSSVQDCSNLAMTVHGVTLTCCSCHRHGKHIQCFRVCETIVPFVLGDLNADKSPAHKVSLFRRDRRQTHMSSINGLTFLPPSNHAEMLCNAVVFCPTTFQCNAHAGDRHQQLCSQNTSLPQLATSSLFAQLEFQQRSLKITNTASNLVCSSCSRSLHCSSCCGLLIQRHIHGLRLAHVRLRRCPASPFNNRIRPSCSPPSQQLILLLLYSSKIQFLSHFWTRQHAVHCVTCRFCFSKLFGPSDLKSCSAVRSCIPSAFCTKWCTTVFVQHLIRDVLLFVN